MPPRLCPRTLRAILISVQVDWDLLVGMGQGRHGGEKARTGMCRSLTRPVCILLPSPARFSADVSTHAHTPVLALLCRLPWSQADVTRRQPSPCPPPPAPRPSAVLGSAAGRRGNTLCSPCLSPRDEDLKIRGSTIGYSISRANKPCARARGRRGRRPGAQKYAALPCLPSPF